METASLQIKTEKKGIARFKANPQKTGTHQVPK
jgi:hypothetical protein